MRTELMKLCELFADNRDDVAKKFAWESHYMYPVAAVFLTTHGRKADLVRMKECKKILKKNAGAFSNFRQHLALPIVSKMALSDNPEKYIRDLIEIYDRLHKIYTFGSEYSVLAAMMICENQTNQSVDEIINRTEYLLKEIKRNHPFITSREDLAMISMLAMSEKSNEELLEELEVSHELLKREFPGHSNSIQSLTFILAMQPGKTEEKCARTVELFEALKTNGMNFGKSRELASVGSLVGLSKDVSTVVGDLSYAEDYLKNRKGFGAFGTGKRIRFLYAAMLVVCSYDESVDMIAASASTISLAVAIAAQVAVTGAIVASSASSAN